MYSVYERLKMSSRGFCQFFKCLFNVNVFLHIYVVNECACVCYRIACCHLLTKICNKHWQDREYCSNCWDYCYWDLERHGNEFDQILFCYFLLFTKYMLFKRPIKIWVPIVRVISKIQNSEFFILLARSM